MNWREDPVRRWALAIVVGFAIVAVLALVMQQIMERAFGIGYEIHWFETVPFIVVIFAYVLQRGWRPREPEAVILVAEDAEE